MKKTTIYQTEKKAFMFSADCEQRGLNATLKAINATITSPEAVRTLSADGLKKEVLKCASNYVEFLRANLPQVFNKDGALCAVKVVEDTDNNRDIYAGYQIEEISVNNTPSIRVYIPAIKFTCTQVYNLAKKATQGAKRAEKAREKAERTAMNEARKEEKVAKRIAKLQAELNKLQK